MSITVVVPTVDRVDLLRRCLGGLRGADVLVVHDGDPGIRALLDELGVAGLQIEERGVSAKRNAGWRAARTDRVAFTDDDCEPAPGWLDAVRGTDADFVAGPVRPHPEDSVDGLWARTVQAEEPGFYPGCNLVVRRSCLEHVDGFDESLHGGEDTDLAWRVRESGATTAWVDGAVVWHAIRPVTFRQQLRSLPRWAGLPLVVRRHPQLRALAYRRWFWKRTHPYALLALVGLGVAPWLPWCALAALPLLADAGRRSGLRNAPQVVVNDLVETVVLVAGSVRHRAVLL